MAYQNWRNDTGKKEKLFAVLKKAGIPAKEPEEFTPDEASKYFDLLDGYALKGGNRFKLFASEFGDPDTDWLIHDHSDGVNKYFIKEGVTVPEGPHTLELDARVSAIRSEFKK